MNLLNRFITVLIIVALWFLVVVIVAAPGPAVDLAQQGLDWTGQNLQSLNARQPGWLVLLVRAAIIVGVTLLAIALLWAELRHKPTPVVKVKVPSGGQAAVTADSVERRLAWHLDQIADVINTQPHIRTRGASVSTPSPRLCSRHSRLASSRW